MTITGDRLHPTMRLPCNAPAKLQRMLCSAVDICACWRESHRRTASLPVPLVTSVQRLVLRCTTAVSPLPLSRTIVRDRPFVRGVPRGKESVSRTKEGCQVSILSRTRKFGQENESPAGARQACTIPLLAGCEPLEGVVFVYCMSQTFG